MSGDESVDQFTGAVAIQHLRDRFCSNHVDLWPSIQESVLRDSRIEKRRVVIQYVVRDCWVYVSTADSDDEE